MSDPKDSDQSHHEFQSELKEDFLHDKGVIDDEMLQKVHAQLMREKKEPSEKMTPIPIFLLFFFGILLFWGGFYLAKYSGGFRGDVFNETWLPGAGEAKVEKPFDPITHGKKVFARVCQQCHQADGQGLPGVYPPLVNSPWLLDSKNRPVKIILKGMSGPITVLGKSYNGNMPPQPTLKDRDISAVLTYVRQEWGNDGDAITEELVKEIREKIADRKKPWTAEELLKIDPLK